MLAINLNSLMTSQERNIEEVHFLLVHIKHGERNMLRRVEPVSPKGTLDKEDSAPDKETEDLTVFSH